MTLDRIARFMGEVARPFSIISTSTGASIAIVIVANKVEGGVEGAAFIGAALGGLVGLYGFKAWERRKEAEKAADVETARIHSTPASQGD